MKEKCCQIIAEAIFASFMAKLGPKHIHFTPYFWVWTRWSSIIHRSRSIQWMKKLSRESDETLIEGLGPTSLVLVLRTLEAQVEVLLTNSSCVCV